MLKKGRHVFRSSGVQGRRSGDFCAGQKDEKALPMSGAGRVRIDGNAHAKSLSGSALGRREDSSCVTDRG